MTKTMRSLLIVAALAPAVAGCAAQQSDATGCAAALLGSGTSDPIKLLSVAAGSPACVGLASDAIAAIVQDVAGKQAARGVPR
jgi:hypothetical protein